MKITSHKGHSSGSREFRKMQANIGCDKCPVCGERCSTRDAPCGKGIQHYTHTYYKSLFNMNRYRADKYHCWTCGSRWESEEYVV